MAWAWLVLAVCAGAARGAPCAREVLRARWPDTTHERWHCAHRDGEYIIDKTTQQSDYTNRILGVGLKIYCEKGSPPLSCEEVPALAAAPRGPDLDVLELHWCTVPRLHCLLAALNALRAKDIQIFGDTSPTADMLAGLEHVAGLQFIGEDSSINKTIPRSALSAMRDLSTFSMSKAQFSIPPEGFAHPSLKILKLHEGGITYVPPGAFRDLGRLRTLDLSKNNLTEITEEVFKGLAYLTELNLEACGLRALPPLTVLTPNLRSLIISKNALQALPALGNLRKLERLEANDNAVASLAPDALAGLPALEIVYLHRNRLAALPAAIFRESRKLYIISISENQIEELPADLFQGLSRLTILFLSSNRLQALPPGVFRDLAALKHLFLDGNQLAELAPALLRPLRSLAELDLHDNLLEVLQDDLLQQQAWLLKLNLSNNRLRELQPRVFRATRLMRLDLSRNNLTTVTHETESADPTSPLDSLANLRYLNLSHNHLQGAPGQMLRGPNLETVDLTYNDITTIDIVGVYNGAIPVIDLRHNEITHIRLDLQESLFQNHDEREPIELVDNTAPCVCAFAALGYRGHQYHLCIDGTPILEDNFVLEDEKEVKLAPDAFANQTELKDVYLAWRRIRELPATVFRNLYNLETINLYANQIEELPVDVFQGLTQVTYLSLSTNRLRALPPGVFRDLAALQQLLLDHNRLAELAPALLLPLRALVRLDLGANLLEVLPDDLLQQQTNLVELDLAGNRLRQLQPRALRGAAHLQTLDLSWNNLTTADDSASSLEAPLRRLPELRSLNVSRNRLQRAPEQLLSNSHLEALDLSHNDITTFDVDVAVANKKLVIDLRYNRLADLDQSKKPSCHMEDRPLYCDCAFSDRPYRQHRYYLYVTPQGEENTRAAVKPEGGREVRLIDYRP